MFSVMVCSGFLCASLRCEGPFHVPKDAPQQKRQQVVLLEYHEGTRGIL